MQTASLIMYILFFNLHLPFLLTSHISIYFLFELLGRNHAGDLKHQYATRRTSMLGGTASLCDRQCQGWFQIMLHHDTRAREYQETDY